MDTSPPNKNLVEQGSSLRQELLTGQEPVAQEPLYSAPSSDQKEDLFDKLTRNLTADQVTFAAQFCKRFFPVVVFMISAIFGIGVGKTALVSGCMSGIYGEISIFFGVIKIPLYSIPSSCYEVDVVRDFMSIRPLIFLLAFVVVFFVWSYFDSQLTWRSRTDF